MHNVGPACSEPTLRKTVGRKKSSVPSAGKRQASECVAASLPSTQSLHFCVSDVRSKRCAQALADIGVHRVNLPGSKPALSMRGGVLIVRTLVLLLIDAILHHPQEGIYPRSVGQCRVLCRGCAEFSDGLVLFEPSGDRRSPGEPDGLEPAAKAFSDNCAWD